MPAAAGAPVGAPFTRSVEVLIVGAGFGGIAAAIELARHGIDDVTILERAPRARRHLVLQQLPRRRVRRAQPPLLVLLRPAPRLVAAVLAAGGDPRLPARRRARPRRRAPGRSQTAPSPRARGTSSAAAGRSRRPTAPATEADAIDARHRPAATSPRMPRSPGAETFAGHSFHSARLGPRLPARGQARGGRRHRRERRAVRARDRPAGRPADGLPAHRQLVSAAREPPLSRGGPGGDSNTSPGCRRCAGGFMFQYCEALTLSIRHPRDARARARGALGGVHALAAEGPRAAPQGVAATTRSAASACCSARDYLPALQRPNVELVTDAIARVDAARAS